MERDPRFVEECQALCSELSRFRSLTSLRASVRWPELAGRIDGILEAVRSHEPAQAPPPARRVDRVLAVHWNIEHGNWYEQVARALTQHPLLQDADLLLLNEVDFGMARAANLDVTAELAAALGRYGVWAPLFLETTCGRDDDERMAGGRTNQEALFGISILSRWPIRRARTIHLPSPERLQFDLERMVGRHIGLITEIERPGRPFVAVSVHLEVHRTRQDRARQMRTLLEALQGEQRPIVLAGDFNSHTFERGRWWDPFTGAAVLLGTPSSAISRRLLYPDRGGAREPLFDALAENDFEWSRFNDRRPTLQLRLDRLDEARGVMRALGSVFGPALRWAERRGRLRLDWFAGRGWRDGHGSTVSGLDGPGKASDHAPIVAEFLD